VDVIKKQIITILFQVSNFFLGSYLHNCQTACIVNMLQVGVGVKIVFCSLYKLQEIQCMLYDYKNTETAGVC